MGATKATASPSAVPSVLWFDLPTAAGRFTLSPVKPDRDLPLIHRWMNDPEVARYWELDGPLERTADHVYAQVALPYTRPLLARLGGRAIGYWELYQAAADPLAGYYPAEPDDLGIHLLIGEEDCRGLGLGSLLLCALADAVQRERPCRLVAEPDERNLASVRAFTAAGFTALGALDLPEKRATLMLRAAPTQGPAPTPGPKPPTVPSPGRGAA